MIPMAAIYDHLRIHILSFSISHLYFVILRHYLCNSNCLVQYDTFTLTFRKISFYIGNALQIIENQYCYLRFTDALGREFGPERWLN